MEIQHPVDVMMWINIYVWYPFTLLVIGLCCAVRMDHVPITYYINLLALNLIQFVCQILFMAKRNTLYLSSIFLHVTVFGAIGSLYFGMIIALERCFFISRPQLHFIRQTKGFVMICVSVWIFCGVICLLSMFFNRLLLIILFLLPPGLLFIVCLVLTLKSLPAATSVPTEEKRRIVATLVLLLINYTITSLPIFLMVISVYFNFFNDDLSMIFIFLYFVPFLDLILFVVMRKGLIDKLLTCLCCCRMENSAENDSRGTSEAQTDRQNEREEKESKM